MKSIFQKPYVMESLLQTLSLAWNAKEIRELFDTTCKFIQRGESVMPMCDMIRYTLELIIQELVQKAIFHIGMDFGIEIFLRIESESLQLQNEKEKDINVDEREKNIKQLELIKNFTSVSLQTITLTNPKKFSEGFQPPVINVTQKFFPGLLPLSSHILNQLLKIWKACVQKYQLERAPGFFEEIIQKSNFGPLSQLLSSTPFLMDLFKRDFLGYCLELYMKKISKENMDVYFTWLEVVTKKTQKVSELFILTEHKHRKELGLLIWILDSINEHRLKKNFLENCQTVRDLNVKTLEYIIFSIGELIDSLSQDNNEALVKSFDFTIKRTFQKFSSIRSFWTWFQHSEDPQKIQILVTSYSLLYFFIKDLGIDILKGFNWVKVKQVFLDLQNEFERLITFRKAGFSIVPTLIQFFYDKFVIDFVNKDNKHQVSLYFLSCLEFFFLEYLLKYAKEEKHREIKSFGIVSNLQETLQTDLSCLFELINERSDLYKACFFNLSEFTRCHLLENIFQNEKLKEIAKGELQKVLASPTFENEKQFIPLEFDANQNPRHGIVHFVYLVIQNEYSSQTLKEIESAYSKLNKNDNSLYGSIVRGVLQVLFLEKVAGELALSQEMEKTIELWEKPFLTKIITLLENNVSRQIYFLHCLRTVEKINELIGNPKCYSPLHIHQSLQNREELKLARYYLFPFMIQQETEEGKEYQNIDDLLQAGNIQPLIEAVKQLIKKDSKGYLRARVYIASSSYYSFYNKNQPCRIAIDLLNNLKAQLKISDPELKAFSVFTNGGIPLVANDDLAYFFTNARKENEKVDLTMRHLFANVLIITLGTPSTSNHFYTRTFTPEKLSDSVRGPGSTYPNEQDCGYFLEENGQLMDRYDKYKNIFGGSRLYRLAFNFMTWGSKALALLVDLQKNEASIGRVCLHGTFRNDLSLQPFKNLESHLLLKKYVMQRPNLFYFWLTQEPNLIDNNIEAPFFVTQTLYAFWKDLMNEFEKPDTIYKGVYANENETLLYENRIKEKAFDFVIQNAQNLKQPYEAMFQNGGPLKLILDTREKLMKNKLQSTRILSHDVFIQNCASLENKFPMINEFKSFQRFRTIKHLLFLVKFYYWITDKLSGVIKEDEVFDLLLKDAIEKIPSNTDKQNGFRYLKEFEKVWTDVTDNHPNYQVCRIAEQAGEGNIPKFDDNFKLMTIISHHQDDLSSYDHLYRVIKDIVDLQNKICNEKDNFHYQVALFSSDSLPSSMLLNIKSDEDAIGWASYLAFFQNDDLTYDFQGIEHKVI